MGSQSSRAPELSTPPLGVQYQPLYVPNTAEAPLYCAQVTFQPPSIASPLRVVQLQDTACHGDKESSKSLKDTSYLLRDAGGLEQQAHLRKRGVLLVVVGCLLLAATFCASILLRGSSPAIYTFFTLVIGVIVICRGLIDLRAAHNPDLYDAIDI